MQEEKERTDSTFNVVGKILCAGTHNDRGDGRVLCVLSEYGYFGAPDLLHGDDVTIAQFFWNRGTLHMGRTECWKTISGLD